MSDVKKIDVTDAFLRLDEKTTNCQNVEIKGDCKNRIILKAGINICKCIPYSIKQYSTMKVYFQQLHVINDSLGTYVQH